jgi:hypothetical protein
MKKFFIFLSSATIAFLIAFISFLIGSNSIDKQFIYDKGYVQGRLETEESIRNQIRECISEDAEDMADCLENL